MDRWTLELFIKEISNQGRAMRISTQQYNAALAAGPPTRDTMTGHADQVFLAAQSILTCGALVSKMLWMSAPAPLKSADVEPDPDTLAAAEKSKDRCKTLRRELGIKSIPVLESRKVRNSIEHFDARLDAFFDDPDMRVYAERNIGPIDIVIDVASGRPPRHMRHLDPTTHEMTVLDDSVLLPAVADAVIEVADKADAWIERNRPVVVNRS